MFIGVFINVLNIDPITALIWSAAVNGFVAPPILVLIMLIANNRKIMGDRVNGLGLNILGWTTTVLMFGAAIGLVITWFF
jgi:Mn2+/Fe2+ NRAMP family transporter